jgi:hypothetical protein
MKLKLSLVSSCLFALLNWQNSHAQNLSFKANFGSSFSTPKNDLGVAARKGKAMQGFLSGELANHFNYGKKKGFGMKLAAVAGYDYANFLATNGLTELKVSVPNLRLRWYPVSFLGNSDDMKLGKMVDKLPFGVDLLALLLMYTSVNGLHFDYGVGFGNILETAYVEGINFPDQTVKRTMKYAGWGLQPVIFQSESNRFTVNAIFDFGKYSWTNANKGTSGFKSNHLGFGLQWHFLKKGK